MSEIPIKTPNFLTDKKRFQAVQQSPARRKWKDSFFHYLCFTISLLTVGILCLFLGAILYLGVSDLSLGFLTNPPSHQPEHAGLFPAMLGTIWLLVLVALFTLPIGVAAAVILEEFPPKHWLLRGIHGIIQTNITNLAGVPSVVYGIIGLTIFASMMPLMELVDRFSNQSASASQTQPADAEGGVSQQNTLFEFGIDFYHQYYNDHSKNSLLRPVDGRDAPRLAPVDGMVVRTPRGEELKLNVIERGEPYPNDPELARRTVRASVKPDLITQPRWYYIRVPFGRSVLAGALTLMLVVLPIVIIATQEALRAVPESLREASLGLGSTRWQVVQHVTLPAAIPGIMTGSILAMSRAVGEAAPLLMISGIVFIASPPGNLMDDFTAMPLQIYNWAGRPQTEFHDLASSGIVVLLSVLLCFNAVAIFIRQKFRRPLG